MKICMSHEAASTPTLGIVPRPFLKWVGGKRQLLPELFTTMRQFKAHGHYYEPFVGGGALFFAMRATGWTGTATLGDANGLLVRTYLGIRNDVEEVIVALSGPSGGATATGYHYDESDYYTHRDLQHIIANCNNTEVAAWMIYINRCGYNGLWRVNGSGTCNVPFGRYTNPTICDEEGLRTCSVALQQTKILFGDFEKTVRSAEEGDLVYFDPPYVPVNVTSDFTSYTSGGFTFADQQRLRDCALKLKERGVHVMLSNSDTEAVHGLYRHFNVRRVEARRNVNSKASKRGKVGEVIIT